MGYKEFPNIYSIKNKKDGKDSYFKKEKLAAQAYDKYVIENNLTNKLNNV